MGKRLSVETKARIIDDYKSGMTVRQIMKKENVCEATVRKLIKKHIEINIKQTPEERLEDMSPSMYFAKKVRSGQKAAEAEQTESLSYGEQKAAELDPAYYPQRTIRSTNIANNPFLGKRGRIDGTNTPPIGEDLKPHGLLHGFNPKVDGRGADPDDQGDDCADPEGAGDDFDKPEDSAEDPEDAGPENAAELDTDEKRLKRWERVYHESLIIKTYWRGNVS